MCKPTSWGEEEGGLGLDSESAWRNGVVWFSSVRFGLVSFAIGWNASLVSGARNWQTIKAVKKCSQQQIGKAIAREKTERAEGAAKEKTV